MPAISGEEKMKALSSCCSTALPVSASTTWYRRESDVEKYTFPPLTAGEVTTQLPLLLTRHA